MAMNVKYKMKDTIENRLYDYLLCTILRSKSKFLKYFFLSCLVLFAVTAKFKILMSFMYLFIYLFLQKPFVTSFKFLRLDCIVKLD